MRKITFCMILLTAAAATPAATTAFLNVNVVPMSSEQIVPAQTVIVTDGRIAVVDDVTHVSVPENALVVDGTDRYLIPGLGDMHAHVPPADSAMLDRVLTLFAANGVTVVRGMLGHPSHLELRERLERSELLGPRLVTAGPSLNGNSVRGPADAARQVREQGEAGYDFVKIHPGLDMAEFDAIVAEARTAGLPVAGHVPEAVGVEHALAAGMATIDHLDGYIAAMLPPGSDASGGYGGFFGVMLADDADESAIARLARQTAEAKTWIVPTESLIEHRFGGTPAEELAAGPEMRFMPEEVIGQWLRARRDQDAERGYRPALGARTIEIRRHLLLALHEAGANLLLGSDAPQVFNVPGFATHQELGYLVASGLTPYQALRTGTVAVAGFLGRNAGFVATGYEADLVLLDANPLEDIANTRRIHGVMLRGRWYPAAELASRLVPFTNGPGRQVPQRLND